MKKLCRVLLIVICLLSFTGCKKESFSYFKNKIGSIDGYKYYTLTEVVYRENLVLYENKNTVYLNNQLLKIVSNNKFVNDLSSDELYTYSNSEHYIDGNDLYYYENDEWKVKEIESSESDLGINIEKNMFSKYSIYTKHGRDFFKGVFKDDVVDGFLGFDVDGVKDLTLFIEINKRGYVVEVSLSYVSVNGNNVSVSLKPNYSYVSSFELPIVE